MFDAIAWDFDGTLVDSRETAFAITREIAGLFGIKVNITTMTEYRLAFDEIERRWPTESANADILRALHRLLMGMRVASTPVFDPVLALAGRAAIETAIITSGLRTTVLKRIGDRLNNVRVWGHEDGLKEQNLAAWSNGRRFPLYVTDNIRDISHCRACGVAVIAVGWGFDTQEDLIQANPDWFVSDARELKALMEKLNLTD